MKEGEVKGVELVAVVCVGEFGDNPGTPEELGVVLFLLASGRYRRRWREGQLGGCHVCRLDAQDFLDPEESPVRHRCRGVREVGSDGREVEKGRGWSWWGKSAGASSPEGRVNKVRD